MSFSYPQSGLQTKQKVSIKFRLNAHFVSINTDVKWVQKLSKISFPVGMVFQRSLWKPGCRVISAKHFKLERFAEMKCEFAYSLSNKREKKILNCLSSALWGKLQWFCLQSNGDFRSANELFWNLDDLCMNSMSFTLW